MFIIRENTTKSGGQHLACGGVGLVLLSLDV